MVSSMQPFSCPRSRCWDRKNRLDREPTFLAANIITATMVSVTKVRGISSTSMETRVATTLMALLNSWGRL